MASNIYEEELNCSICCNRFDPPKQLPCQHTYCLQCLEHIVDSRRILTCPECRHEHTVPPSGVSGFPTNITIQRLLEAENHPNVPSLRNTRPYTRLVTILNHQFRASNGAIHPEPQYHRPPNRTPEIVISPTSAFPSREPTSVNRTVSSQDLALEIRRPNEARPRGGNERENRETSGVFKKIRKRFQRFTEKILNDHDKAVVVFIIFFFVVTFIRLIAGAVKLSSKCPLEKQAAVYLFVKFWFGLVFWGYLIYRTIAKKLKETLANSCVQVCLVLESLFSFAWLCVDLNLDLSAPFCTAWIMGNFSSINDQCTEYRQWNAHFINFALFLTVVDYIGLVVFLLFTGYEFCDMQE